MIRLRITNVWRALAKLRVSYAVEFIQSPNLLYIILFPELQFNLDNNENHCEAFCGLQPSDRGGFYNAHGNWKETCYKISLLFVFSREKRVLYLSPRSFLRAPFYSFGSCAHSTGCNIVYIFEL